MNERRERHPRTGQPVRPPRRVRRMLSADEAPTREGRPFESPTVSGVWWPSPNPSMAKRDGETLAEIED